ncbi:MAG TPA: hypothetical protein DCQ64_18550 [Candidatus Rokubacteria bacterium]|nr:hypothetical protein [Candidatus Rokubacteria bacterium]
MPEPEIRCWKDPTWEIGMSAGRRTIRLILHHPATHARLGSGFFPADTPADEAASQARLIAWANALAPEGRP